MLKNIPPILSPELLKILCEMGYSDTLVIVEYCEEDLTILC